jgi:hypothetical protein
LAPKPSSTILDNVILDNAAIGWAIGIYRELIGRRDT